MPLLPGRAIRPPAPSLWTSVGQWFECCTTRERDAEGPGSARGAGSPRGYAPHYPASAPADLQLKRGNRQYVNRKHMIAHHSFCQSLADTYDLEDDVLGKGGFGIVRRARFKHAESWSRVVKSIKKTTSSELLVKQEIGIIRSMDHPCICRLYETFEDGDFVHLVMEYIEGSELFDYILEAYDKEEQLGESFSASIMRQVFSALRYCHENGVIHRDLKPENIMVKCMRERTGAFDSPKHGFTEVDMKSDDSEHIGVKLIDFGLATVVQHMARSPGSKEDNGVVGTQEYLAPEAQEGHFTPACDMWSAGLVLHILLVGNLPKFKVRAGELPFSCSDKEYTRISSSARLLLAGLLERDVLLRLDAEAASASEWTLGKSTGSLDRSARSGDSEEERADVMSDLMLFHKSNKLRQAALTALAMHTSSAHLHKLEEQFLEADIDGNGCLSRQELEDLVGQSDMTVDARSFVAYVFDSIDTDGSGSIEYTEFLAAASELHSIDCESAMIAAFNVFDFDRNGKISVSELGRILLKTPEEIASLLPQFDTDGDGQLDYEEFKQLLSQAPQSSSE